MFACQGSCRGISLRWVFFQTTVDDFTQAPRKLEAFWQLGRSFDDGREGLHGTRALKRSLARYHFAKQSTERELIRSEINRRAEGLFRGHIVNCSKNPSVHR